MGVKNCHKFQNRKKNTRIKEKHCEVGYIVKWAPQGEVFRDGCQGFVETAREIGGQVQGYEEGLEGSHS